MQQFKITINFYFFKLGYKRNFLFIWGMTYASNILNDYNAVLAHVDKMQSIYAKYGICFLWKVLLNEEGYKVVALPVEVELTN